VVEIIQGQIQVRLNEVGQNPILALEDVFSRNYKLGLAHGLALAIRLPNDMYNEIHRVYTEKLEEIRDANAQ
jgi:hypothetical protein